MLKGEIWYQGCMNFDSFFIFSKREQRREYLIKMYFFFQVRYKNIFNISKMLCLYYSLFNVLTYLSFVFEIVISLDHYLETVIIRNAFRTTFQPLSSCVTDGNEILKSQIPISTSICTKFCFFLGILKYFRTLINSNMI